jgi:hypothetical protein
MGVRIWERLPLDPGDRREWLWGDTELTPGSFISGLSKLRFQGKQGLRTPHSGFSPSARLAPLRLTAYSS